MLKKNFVVVLFSFSIISCQSGSSNNLAVKSPSPENKKEASQANQKEDNKMKTFLETDTNITVEEGKEFIIKLDSNGTTGYKWALSKDLEADFIQLVKSEYKTPENAAVGTGGTESWQFKPLKKGESEIKLKYARPWEKDIAPIKELTFKIKVT